MQRVYSLRGASPALESEYGLPGIPGLATAEVGAFVRLGRAFVDGLLADGFAPIAAPLPIGLGGTTVVIAGGVFIAGGGSVVLATSACVCGVGSHASGVM